MSLLICCLLLQTLLSFQYCSVFAVKELNPRAEQLEEDRKIWSNCVTTNGSNGTCRCGASLHHAISCSDDDDTLQVQPCYCLYYDTSQNKTLAGCYFAEKKYNQVLTRYSVQNGSLFNQDMCSSMININREGHFCGKTLDWLFTPTTISAVYHARSTAIETGSSTLLLLSFHLLCSMLE